MLAQTEKQAKIRELMEDMKAEGITVTEERDYLGLGLRITITKGDLHCQGLVEDNDLMGRAEDSVIYTLRMLTAELSKMKDRQHGRYRNEKERQDSTA